MVEKVKKILRVINIIIIAGMLYYFRHLLIDNNNRMSEFSKKQDEYKVRMDSLKIISEQLIKNVAAMDSKISSSKKAIDDLRKTPIVVKYTNEEALDFLRQFAYKYNALFKDTLND